MRKADLLRREIARDASMQELFSELSVTEERLRIFTMLLPLNSISTGPVEQPKASDELLNEPVLPLRMYLYEEETLIDP